jgi:predicted DNA-binding transcriptional regulator YafY
MILPDALSFGSNKWHPKPQWLLRAFDVKRGEWRHFAVADIKSWRQEEETEEP